MATTPINAMWRFFMLDPHYLQTQVSPIFLHENRVPSYKIRSAQQECSEAFLRPASEAGVARAEARASSLEVNKLGHSQGV
jgi:hypothetical protein